jgi:hypothetical protein
MKTSARSSSKQEVWREMIRQQEKSGLSVPVFCRERGVSEQLFYWWRKRLKGSQPVRFALVETEQTKQPCRSGVEVWLSGGERLQIAAGVDAATLRTVLAVLRER